MENSLIKSILEICKMLNKHGVEYLIVGGTAVGFYGYYRGSTASNGIIALGSSIPGMVELAI